MRDKAETIMKIHPSQIYDTIREKIGSIISSIEQNAEDQLKAVASDSLENLGKINEKIQNEYHDLKKSSEWDRFTIAFYGETNAGKSTLIEALRLLWKEEGKLEEQERFKTIQQKSGLTQEAFDNIQRAISDSEENIIKSQNTLADLERKHAYEAAKAQAEIQRLTALLQEISDRQGWWKKILVWFSPPPEKHQLSEAKNDFDLLLARQADEKAAGKNALSALQSHRNQLKEKQAFFQKEAEELSRYADGRIIGEGQSDHTLHNTEFKFEVDNRSFILIDMPGIEGKEYSVQTLIEKAVSKAHAVFYMTCDPRPPQSHEGESGSREGTLEKIGRHLGAQTEVWAIYNHRGKNPRALKNPLLDEDTQRSLRALNEKMKEKLGQKYFESFTINAHAAYLALAKCLVPGEKTDEKRKFLERFSQEELLEKSGLNGFSRELLYRIMDNYQVKIWKANIGKASNILKTSLKNLRSSYESFDETARKIADQNKHTISSIDQLLEQFKGTLDAIKSREIRKFSLEVENQVYDQIEKDISNDEFKGLLKQTLEKEAHNLESSLQRSVRNDIDEFTKEIKDITKRACEHLKDIMAAQERQRNIGDFDISINIDNGINVWGLVTSGIGAVLLLASNPGGWAVMTLGAVGLLVGAIKSLWGLFDSSFKRSQQRKATDEAIEKARKSIEKALQKTIDGIQREMEQQLGKVKEEIGLPGKQCKIILSALSSAHQQLSALDARIDSQLHQGKSA